MWFLTSQVSSISIPLSPDQRNHSPSLVSSPSCLKWELDHPWPVRDVRTERDDRWVLPGNGRGPGAQLWSSWEMRHLYIWTKSCRIGWALGICQEESLGLGLFLSLVSDHSVLPTFQNICHDCGKFFTECVTLHKYCRLRNVHGAPHYWTGPSEEGMGVIVLACGFGHLSIRTSRAQVKLTDISVVIR